MPSGIYKRIKPVSDETKKKLSDSKKGKIPKFIPNNNGIKRSSETKIKIGLSGLGRIPWNKGKKTKKHTIETRKKMSEKRKGDKHWNYKGGLSSINTKIRNSLEYKLWREAVFKRDNHTCVFCGNRSSKGNPVRLEADHIKPFSLFPELRFAIDNGRTLCHNCHKTTDTYGQKAKSYEK